MHMFLKTIDHYHVENTFNIKLCSKNSVEMGSLPKQCGLAISTALKNLVFPQFNETNRQKSTRKSRRIQQFYSAYITSIKCNDITISFDLIKLLTHPVIRLRVVSGAKFTSWHLTTIASNPTRSVNVNQCIVIGISTINALIKPESLQ